MNWDEIQQSDDYQNADDYAREIIRNDFRENVIQQYGLDDVQANDFRTKFDHVTAPRGNVLSEWDSLKSIGSGALSATADMVQGVTLGQQNEASQYLRGLADEMAMDRRPSTVEAVENFGFGEGQEITGKGLLYNALSGAGSMAPMLVGGGAVGMGAKALGRSASGYGKAKKALDTAENAVDAKAAAHKLGTLDKWNDRVGNAAGFGAVGAAMIGGGAGEQAIQEVMALDDNTIYESDAFQEYYRQEFQVNPENRRAAFDSAKKRLADDLATGAFAKAAAAGGVSMAVLGPALSKIVMGRGAQGVTKNSLAGAGTEGIQETIETGGQQLATNMELAALDNRNVWDNVPEAAATGALVGGVVGGAAGAPGGLMNRGAVAPSQEDYAGKIRDNLNESALAEQQLPELNERLKFLETELANPAGNTPQTKQLFEDTRAQHDQVLNDIRRLAMENATLENQMRQARSVPQTLAGNLNTGMKPVPRDPWEAQQSRETRPGEWSQWNAPTERVQSERYESVKTNPFNQSGVREIGRDDGKPFASLDDLNRYVGRHDLTRYPFHVAKVKGGYVLVGMPDAQQQNANIVRVQTSEDFDRVLEGQFIPLSDVAQFEQYQRASRPVLENRPVQQPSNNDQTADLFQTEAQATAYMQRNRMSGTPVQVAGGYWRIDEARQQPGALEDKRRTFVDSTGAASDDLSTLNNAAREKREQQVAKQHPGYAYDGTDADYQKYSAKASELNKLMRKFQGDPRDRESFNQLRQLIKDTKKLEKAAMEQARASKRPIATVNRTELLRQARTALEAKRLDEFNSLVSDIRATNAEEQARLTGQPSANDQPFIDSRLQQREYRDYLQAVAQEVDHGAREANRASASIQDDDSLLTAVGKLGGIHTDSIESTVKESIDSWRQGRGAGILSRYVNRGKNAKTLDDMGRTLAGYGYTDTDGQEFGANTLTDAIMDEVRGRPRFSDAMADYQAVMGGDTLFAAEQANNATAPAINAALNGEPLSPAYRKEIIRVLNDAEIDPKFSGSTRDLEDFAKKQQENAAGDDWFDRYEPSDISYAEGKTGLDSDQFTAADWKLIEAEARRAAMLSDAAANEQQNRVEEDERETDSDGGTGPRVRYGGGRRPAQASGERAEAGREQRAQQRDTDQTDAVSQPTEKSIDSLLGSKLESDPDDFVAYARKLAQDNTELTESVNEWLRDVLPFYEHIPGAKTWLKVNSIQQKQEKAYRETLALFNGEHLGAQLQKRKDEHTRYAMILPDASQPGRFRASYYDADGFSYHDTQDTAEKAFREAVKSGFTEKAEITLDELAATERWQKGMSQVFSMQDSFKPKEQKSEEDESFNLSTQTEAELQQQAEQQQAAEAETKSQEQQAQQKADADRERNDFVLTGSNSASDQAAARGQNDMFSATGKSKPAGSEPTEAQKQAGNYKKEHIKLQGLDISLENLKGSTRSGTDPDGNDWEVTMQHHYGYIKRTEGADGDHVDVFVGDNPDSEKVFVVDQVNKDGSFDEHKVMLGFDDRASAVSGYKSNYEDGWVVGKVTELSVADFKDWLKNGDTTKPVAKQRPVTSSTETDALSDEYHMADAEQAFQHSSRSGAKSHRDSFIKTVQRVYNEALPKAETDKQKSALDEAIRDYKQAYLKAEKAYFRVREGVASSHIAGRNNFNGKQAERRGKSADNALDTFNRKLSSLESGVTLAVSNARTPEQVSKDSEAREQKARKTELDRALVSVASTLRDIADQMRGGREALAKDTRKWAIPKAFESLEQALVVDREKSIAGLKSMDEQLGDVGGLLKVAGARSKLGKAYRELTGEKPVTSKADAGKKSRSLKTDSASKVMSNINADGYSTLSDGAEIRTVTDASDPHAEIKTEDGTRYRQPVESLQGGDVKKAVQSLLADYFAGKAEPVKDNDTDPTPPEGGKPESKSLENGKDWNQATLESYIDAGNQALKGELALDEHKAAALSLLENKDAVMAELSTMTKKAILEANGGYFEARWRNEKKDEVVKAAYWNLIDFFNPSQSISYAMGKGAREAAYRRVFENLTQEQIDDYREKRQARIKEIQKRNEERVKALENPETLDEYRYYVEAKGEKSLNPDQLEQYDALLTEDRVNKALAEEEKRAEVSGVSGDVSYTTAETTHAKKGIPLYVLSLADRVEGPQFNELRGKAKVLGGWYSSFKKSGAIPGFQFETEQARQKFINVLAGETESGADTLEQKQQTAQEKRTTKLRQMADDWEKSGEEVISRDRKTNTAKRAREAASAITGGENAIRTGRLMRQIAEGVEQGMFKLLSRLNAKTQLDELRTIQNQALWSAPEELVFTDSDSRRYWNDDTTDNQKVAEAKFSPVELHKEHLVSVLESMSEKSGYKQAGRVLLKSAKKETGYLLDISKSPYWAYEDKLRAFARSYASSDYSAERLKETYMSADRLKKMGVTDLNSLRHALRELYQAEKGVQAVKRDRLKEMELELVGQKFPGFFPTPEPVVETLLEQADIQPGMSVLEPSAGKGDIADGIRQAEPEADITVIEIQKRLRDYLEARDFQPEGMDFLEHEGSYDRIVMNPPFEEGQDMVHVRHAFNQLKPGGRLVAVMSAMSGKRARKQDQQFSEWVEEHGGTIEPLPEGAFKSSFRPTGVNTQMLVMDKSEGDNTEADSDNRYRVNESNAAGISRQVAQQASDSLADSLGVQVNIADTEADLPQHVRDAMKRDSASGIKGVFDRRNGQAWIVAANLNDMPDAVRTILHEVAGHQALTNMFGSTMKSIMARIHNDMPADVRTRIEGTYESQLSGMDAQTRKAVIAEEYLAHLAETKPSSSTLKRFISKIRRVLRQLFPDLKWTQDDAIELLEAARKKLKDDNTPGGPGGGSRTSTASRSDDASTGSPNRYRTATMDVMGSLPDDIAEAMRRTNAGVRQQQGIVERVKTWFSDMELADKSTWKEYASRVYTGFVDQFNPIAKLEEQANNGELKEGAESAYKAALRTKNLSGIMTAILGKGTPMLENGSVIVRKGSKGLLEIIEPIAQAGNLELWEHWAAAQRAQRLLSEGRENLFTQADIDSINRYVDARPDLKKQFQQVHANYQTFNRQILDFAEDAGLINADARQLWESDDYLPFHRVNRLDEGSQTGLLRRKGMSNQESGIKRLEGGVEQISPLEAIYRNTESLVDASLKNIAMQRIAEVGTAAGVMEKTRSGDRMTAEQVAARLTELGIINEGDSLSDEQVKRWGNMLVKFQDLGDGAVKISRDGKTEVYQVNDPALLETMQAMGVDTLDGVLKVFAAPKRLLTAMVTSDPGFMARNFIRDTLSTWMSVHPKIDGQTLHASMMGAVRNITTGMESDDHWALMMAGGGSGGYYEITPDNIRAQITPGQHKAHHRRVLDNLTHSWQWWQKQGGRFENANRLAVYADVIEKGGSISEAAHQAQDVLNFTRRGKWQTTRILIETIPFLNARIQGLDRLIRGGVDNPAAMLQRGLIYMSASIALWSLFADDERYKELPEHEKLTWHHFWDDEGNHYRIPKPFEMGALFATVPEIFNNVVFNGEDGQWAGKMIGGVLTDVFAMSLPQFMAPAVDVGTNTNSFTGAPILSLGMQYQTPESQYTPWTSETLKALAEAMPDAAPEWMRSPKRLEHLFRGYFGTLGSYAMSITDGLAREARGATERPDSSIRSMPILGSFFRGSEPGATRYSTELYEMMREANELSATIKAYQEQGLLGKAAKLQEENAAILSNRTAVNRHSRKISALRKQVREILDNRFMSSEVKRKRINDLNRQISDAYREGVQE